jgi:hypothetical protein
MILITLLDELCLTEFKKGGERLEGKPYDLPNVVRQKGRLTYEQENINPDRRIFL